VIRATTLYPLSSRSKFVFVCRRMKPFSKDDIGNLKDICSLGLDEWEWLSKVPGSFNCTFNDKLSSQLMTDGVASYFCMFVWLSRRQHQLCLSGILFVTTSGRFQQLIRCFLLDFSVSSSLSEVIHLY